MLKLKIKCSRINMDTAAGGSGDDGRGNRRFSAGKEKTQVNPQPKPRKKRGVGESNDSIFAREA